MGSSSSGPAQPNVPGGDNATTPQQSILQSIIITAPNTSLAKGLSEQLAATGHYSDGTTHDVTSAVIWSSSVAAVIALNANGIVTAAAASGTSNVSASQNGVMSNSVMFTANPALLQSITIAAANASLAKGLTEQFTATGTLSDGTTQELTHSAVWTSSNPAAVRMDANGLATGSAIGSSAINAAQNGISSNSLSLSVTPAVLVSLSVSAAQNPIAKGTIEQFSATGHYSDGSTQDLTGTANWSSSDSMIATTSATGLVNAVNAGPPVTITALQGSIAGTATLNVTAFTISGSLGYGGAGATVSLSGPPNSTTADSKGNFMFSNLGTGVYIVTPNLAGASFSPFSQTVTFTADYGWVLNPPATSVNFTTSGGQLSIVPSNISFDSVNVGSTSQVPAVLSASGGDVTIIACTSSGVFGLNGLTLPLKILSGQTSPAFNFTFSPVSAGAVNANLSFVTDASNNPSITLSGFGVGLSVTSALNFGTVQDGTSSAPRTGTLTALGSSVTVSSASLVQAGGGGSAFSISGLPSLPFTLAAGAAQNFTVIFSPALDHPGPASGTLSFISNVNTVAQTFSGIAGGIVQLSWTASTTPGMTYNVYRCAGSSLQCEIPFPNFAEIQAASTETSYTDTGVISGGTYYYFVTAVDSQGIESLPSTVSNPAVIP